MSQVKTESGKQETRRRASRVRGKFSPDGDVEVRGNMVYLHGHLAEELKKVARQRGRTIEAALHASLRLGLPGTFGLLKVIRLLGGGSGRNSAHRPSRRNAVGRRSSPARTL